MKTIMGHRITYIGDDDGLRAALEPNLLFIVSELKRKWIPFQSAVYTRSFEKKVKS